MNNPGIAGRMKISERSTKDGRAAKHGSRPLWPSGGEAWNLFRGQHPRAAIEQIVREFLIPGWVWNNE